jgi:hypothetical protein
MRGPPESLAALRLLLTERFPQAAPRPAAVLPTGVGAIDDVTGGGLPVGGITEVVALAPSSGGQLLISSLLAATRARRMRAALVDARDAFDPQSHEPLLLQHLVWVRCRTLDEAMHAADILVRDANLALVMLDLRGLELRALRSVPATTWYRLQRALERTDMAMVVLTAENRESGRSEKRETGNAGFVGSARLRLNLASAFALSAFDEEQSRLASTLPAEVQRSCVHEERRIA